jgi:sodium/bile acid cotransporter 7
MNEEGTQKTSTLLKKLSNGLGRIGLDGFILALLSMILLAWLWPQGGTGDGPFSLSELANYGVSVIFFFYGLRLSRAKLVAGLGNWRLHILVQGSTFILFPLLVLPCKALLPDDLQLLWLGAFFLSSLPSTVSSSVVMVSIAEGNIPAAIFNASISSIVGVFITPLWVGVVNTSQAGGDIDFFHIVGKLVLQVLVPVALGIILNPRWGQWADRYKAQLKYFDQTIILIIVYTAFCESFGKNMFANLSWLELGGLAVAMLLLFFVAYGCIGLLCRLLGFSYEDRVTATFCGSKKSIVHGTVMSKVLFPGSTATGILLLPVMLYHALQLIVVSLLARRLTEKRKRPAVA